MAKTTGPPERNIFARRRCRKTGYAIPQSWLVDLPEKKVQRPLAGRGRLLRRVIPQASGSRRRLRFVLGDALFVFGGEIQQSFLGERVGLFGETAAAFCLLFQSCQIHHSPIGAQCQFYNSVLGQ